MPTISVFMEVADTFIPTAGADGLLPMITYFFLVVAVFAFLGTFIFTLATQKILFSDQVQPSYRIASILTAISAATAGLTYYLIQFYYHAMLAELATVIDPNDRQTLIRESYNAIGQYRYMAWFVVAPFILFQIISLLKIPLRENKRPVASLLMAAASLFFVSYIGHQQLSFDNEIQIGAKLTWGLVALITYVYSLFALNRLGNEFGGKTHSAFRITALTTGISWGIYLIGYVLTIFAIDFNWLHIVFTIADMVSIIGVGIVAYLVNTNRWNSIF